MTSPAPWVDRPRLVVPLLFALVLLAYLPALRAGFIWDDDDYVTQNAALTDTDGLRRIWLTPGATPQYYPLVFTSFWIERRLYGLAPFGYHLVNVLLHAGNAALLWALLRRLRAPAAFGAAVLFALHPVHVESVAWVTERKNVLSLAAYLVSLLAYTRWCGLASGDPSRRDAGTGRESYLLALGAFLAALLAKSVTCSLPAALLLLVYWRRGRLTRRDVGPLLPFFALGALLAATTVWMEKAHVGAVGDDWSMSGVERVLVAGRVPWAYAAKLVLPYPLAFIYPRWVISPTSVIGWLFPLATVGVLIGLFAARARLGRGPFVAAAFFVGTLTPALGIFDVYPMRYSFLADHFQYHASLGLLVLAAVGLERAARGRLWPTLGVAAVFGTLTFARAPVFHDLESLWRDTIAKNPNGWMAHHNLAMLYFDQGRNEEAIAHYSSAIAIRPDLAQTHFNLGTALVKLGRTEEAEAELAEAVRLDPKFVEARNNYANLLQRLGRLPEAIAQYRETIRLLPDYAAPRQNLAFALAEVGDYAGAIDAYRELQQAQPGDANTALRLAWLWSTVPVDSLRDGPAAVALMQAWGARGRGEHGPTLNTLAAAYAEVGRFEDALAALEHAERIAAADPRVNVAAQFGPARERYLARKPFRVTPPITSTGMKGEQPR